MIASVLVCCGVVGMWDEPEAVALDEVRAVVAGVIAESEGRRSLPAAPAGVEAGAGGFFIRSEDGAFRLRIGGAMQLRYLASFRDDAGGGEDGQDDFESGFTVARPLLLLSGHIHDPRLTFSLRAIFGGSGGAGFLDDALIGYRVSDRVSLRAGQGISTFQREWNMGDLRLLGVERSINALVFGQARSQFVEAAYQGDALRLVGTFSDGFRSQSTDLGDDPADWALTGRAEWKFAGEWSAIAGEFRGAPGTPLSGAVGAAVHFERGPDRGTGAAQDLLAWTADVFVKGSGWNVLGAATGYHVTDEAGVGGADFFDWGFVVQGGHHLTERLEVFGRYEMIFPDGDRAADDEFRAVAAGVNYFIAGQAARVTLQATWLPDPTTGTAAGNFANAGARAPVSTAYGILPDSEGDQVVVVAQFQLLF